MKRLEVLGFVLIVLISLVFDFLYFNYTTDDAFISFRYAKNLAEGKGLVFNAGERVEGYTNFLWTILMTPAFLLKVDILIWHKIIGIIFSVLTLFFLWRTGSKILGLMKSSLPTTFALIPPLLLALIPSYAIYTVNGMENPLFTFLLTLFVYFFVEENRGFASGLVAGLLSLTRPEGMMFFALGVLVALFYRRKGNYFSNLFWSYLAVVIPFVIFRAGYYSDIFPNSFYAKLGVPAWLRIKSWGKGYLVGLFRVYPYTIFVWAAIIVIPLLFNKGSLFLFPFFGFFGFMLYSVYAGGDMFPYFRFFALVLPLGALSILGGLVYLFADTKTLKQIHYAFLILALLVWGGLLVRVGVQNFRELNRIVEYKPFRTRPLAAHWDFWVSIGERLKEILPKGSTVVVQDVGAIPFYSELNIIDPIGLVDSTLAHFFFRERYNDYYQGYLSFETCSRVHKFVRDYILEHRKPEAILYHVDSRDCNDLSISFHYHYLYIDPRFLSDYKEHTRFENPEKKCVYILYVRSSSSVPAQTPEITTPTIERQRVPKRSKSYILY